MPIRYTPTTPLNEREQIFVEAYCGESNFSAYSAAITAGYAPSTAKRARAMVTRPHIARSIKRKLENKKNSLWYTEDDVLKMLYAEATATGKGTSHASRIQALVWLGKHIGMWQEKVETASKEATVSYQVINYNTKNDKLEKDVECLVEQNIKELETVKQLPVEVEIQDYTLEPRGVENANE